MPEGVRYNQRALKALEELSSLPEIAEELRVQAESVAARARQLAPKDSGEGAASIHAELADDPLVGLHYRVSWDREHFYMYFAETGTETQSPTPFLRPAANYRS